jgi:hypothetical protein
MVKKYIYFGTMCQMSNVSKDSNRYFRKKLVKLKFHLKKSFKHFLFQINKILINLKTTKKIVKHHRVNLIISYLMAPLLTFHRHKIYFQPILLDFVIESQVT